MASVLELLKVAQAIQAGEQEGSTTRNLARALGSGLSGFIGEFRSKEEREASKQGRESKKLDAKLKMLQIEKKESDLALDKAVRQSPAFRNALPSAFDIINNQQFDTLGESEKQELDTTSKSKVNKIFKTSFSFPVGSGRVSLTERETKATKSDIRQFEKDVITQSRKAAQQEQIRRLVEAGKFKPESDDPKAVIAPIELEKAFEGVFRARLKGNLTEADRLTREIENKRKKELDIIGDFGTSINPGFNLNLPEL